MHCDKMAQISNYIDTEIASISTIVGDLSIYGALSVGGTVSMDSGALEMDGTAASWKSKTIRSFTMTSSDNILVSSSPGNLTPSNTVRGYIVSGYTDSTIYYLGHS